MVCAPEEIVFSSDAGRGGNVWLSPLGCAMSSVHVRVSMTSHLGQRPAFLQHIAGLAVVEALTSLQGYQVRVHRKKDRCCDVHSKVKSAINTLLDAATRPSLGQKCPLFSNLQCGTAQGHGSASVNQSNFWFATLYVSGFGRSVNVGSSRVDSLCARVLCACLQTIDVRLKWPNDIWFSNKMKLGGVLVQSTIMQQTMHANVGEQSLPSAQILHEIV